MYEADINKELEKIFSLDKLEGEPLNNLKSILDNSDAWIRGQGIRIRDKLNIQKLMDNV